VRMFTLDDLAKDTGCHFESKERGEMRWMSEKPVPYVVLVPTH